MIDAEAASAPAAISEDDLRRLLDAPRGAADSAAAGAPQKEPQDGLQNGLHAAPSSAIGVQVGVLIAFADPATPIVVCAAADGPALPARTTVDLAPEHIGAEVLLAFERGDPARPIVIGRLRKPAAWPVSEAPPQIDVDADGKRLTLAAKEQLVLRCGQASITLTAAGKVLIQGNYVSSRSGGVNRIKGGSVQIN